jgi:hypothetical protein
MEKKKVFEAQHINNLIRAEADKAKQVCDITVYKIFFF